MAIKIAWESVERKIKHFHGEKIIKIMILLKLILNVLKFVVIKLDKNVTWICMEIPHNEILCFTVFV